MGSECNNNEKFNKLEATVTKLASEMTLLVSSIAKISDAVELMARTATTTEYHTEQIDVLHKRVTKNEDTIHTMEASIYQSCDTKSQEITRANRRVEDKLGIEVEKMEDKITDVHTKGENRSNRYLALGLSILVFAFGYLVVDYRAGNAKMDKILTVVIKTEKDVAVLATNQIHMQKELDTNHKGSK